MKPATPKRRRPTPKVVPTPVALTPDQAVVQPRVDVLEDAPHLLESKLANAVLYNPSSMSLRLDLANFLIAQNRDRDASVVLRNALLEFPEHCLMMFTLGEILHLYPAFQDEAIELFRRVISINSMMVAAYRPLAWTLARCGRNEEAITALRAWCAAAPQDAVALHLLAAYAQDSVPDGASDAFVAQTFDQAAGHFDTQLRDVLEYRAPEALGRHLSALLPASAKGSLHVLDMGCGTGLSAAVLKPWAQHLTGVDLSSGMLAKARERGAYDELLTAELTAFLDQKNLGVARFDFLFGADTLIYFGRLEAVMANAFTALRPGGWVAFTVEHLSTMANDPTSKYKLDKTGRYKHSEEYVKSVLCDAGFLSPHIILDQVRLELDVPQIALVVAAMKPT